MTIAQATSTYSYIEQMVRHLTASASQAALPSSTIEQLTNIFYNQDFPNAIKTDQLRTVYKFVTIPNVDRYPVDANSYQGFRGPVYFEGIQGGFFKNRDQLFNLYPRFPTQYQQGTTSLSGNITNVVLSGTSPVRIISVNHGLSTGNIVVINGVTGTVELNGNSYTITRINASAFDLQGTDSSTFTPYISGGSWITTSPDFSFTLFGNNQNPFPQNNFGILSTQLVIGGIDIFGNPIRVIDDGGAKVNQYGIGSNTTKGNLIYINTNNVGANVYLSTLTSPIAGPANVQFPAVPPVSPLGGGNAYYNPNYPSYTNPSTPQYCGTVDYITTQINLNLPVPPQPGSQLNIWASQYQTGRPYNLLWWNNEFTIRPVPDNVYLVEVEAYMTPVQFMQTTDDPIINQYAQYIAYGVATEILRQRQDMEGVQNLMEGFKRQAGLILEKQACEEIGIPNITIFNNTNYGYANGGIGYGIGFGF